MGSTAALFTVVAPATPSRSPDDVKELKHHVKPGKLFANPWPSFGSQEPGKFISSILWRKVTGKRTGPDVTKVNLPVRKPEFLPTRETKTLRATWLGHACYYVEFPGGFRVLFDPVFEDCCAPVNLSAFKRYTKPPCEVEDLPFVDAVVISHAHYDHLSYDTVMRIQKKYPEAHFFAPLGNKKWFNSCGIENVTELDWWEEREIKDKSSDIAATLSCLPSQHFANRGLLDRNHTLWASWSIHSGGKKLWFGGDTGYRSVPSTVPENESKHYSPDIHGKLPYCPAFKEIGELRGPFDLGLIPIGAYEPRYFMSPIHANPYDAVNIFKDTKCKKAMGIHWGTWILTEEEVDEPPRLLKDALKSNGLPETGVFDVCDTGESREFE